jgi:hypothetical protein
VVVVQPMPESQQRSREQRQSQIDGINQTRSTKTDLQNASTKTKDQPNGSTKKRIPRGQFASPRIPRAAPDL